MIWHDLSHVYLEVPIEATKTQGQSSHILVRLNIDLSFRGKKQIQCGEERAPIRQKIWWHFFVLSFSNPSSSRIHLQGKVFKFYRNSNVDDQSSITATLIIVRNRVVHLHKTLNHRVAMGLFMFRAMFRAKQCCVKHCLICRKQFFFIWSIWQPNLTVELLSMNNATIQCILKGR